MRLMIKKMALLLLIPAMLMGVWAAPAAGVNATSTAAQSGSAVEAPARMMQLEATPVTTEPEEPAPANTDPASTSPAKENGATTVAPADFPNICDGTYMPAEHPVVFTVDYPDGYEEQPLEVIIFAENGGCIRGNEYQVSVYFPEKDDSPFSQIVHLPAGRYVYQYSVVGFQPESYVPFQVDGVEDTVTITPVPIPAAEQVTLNVTIPAGGSSMNIVISDQSGVVESFVATETGTTEFRTKLPARGLDYDYYYEYWGDDYPWSDRQPFQVEESTPEVITIAPEIAAITLTPSQAPAGTSVEVRVTGFRAGDEYELNFNNGQYVDYGRADINGEIFTTFTVPDGLAPGKYPVVVTGAVSGQRVEATFTVGPEVEPVVTLNPTSGPAGMVVTVSGNGYPSGEQVDIYFGGANGQRVGYVDARQDGTFIGRITIPRTTASGEQIIAATSVDGSKSAEASFVVDERTVEVTPGTVDRGTVVTVSGNGFSPGEIVDIYWETASGSLLGYREVDPAGAFTGRVTIPRTASGGSHTIVVQGRGSKVTATATVSVTAPQVSVSPTTQTSGKVVSVSGSGFASNTRVDIRWNSPSGKLLGYLTASSTGTISGKVTVPAGTVPGDYSIVMIQPGKGSSGSATLHVTGAAVKVTPSEASPGTVVSVSGSGFGPSEVVNIRWNGPAGTLLGYRTTSNTGAMSGKVTIPKNAAPGTYTLHLQGQDSGIVGSVTVVIPATTSLDYPQTAWQGHVKRNHLAIAFNQRQAG